VAPTGFYSLNTDTDTITERDPDTGAVVKIIPAPEPVSVGAGGLAFSGTEIFFFSQFGGGATLYTLDPVDGSVLNSFAMETVDALAYGKTSFGPTLFARRLGEIQLLDPVTGDLYATISPSVSLIGGMDFDSVRGTLFVTSAFSGPPALIYEIDPETGAVLNTFAAPGTAPLGIGSHLGRLFAAETTTDRIYELDPATGTILNSFEARDSRTAALAGAPLIRPAAIPEPSSILVFLIVSLALVRHFQTSRNCRQNRRLADVGHP
jgi:outer membrane protein assembly factor BamB